MASIILPISKNLSLKNKELLLRYKNKTGY
jgi:hypothetical protein